ncbi:MAG: Concanavalin A-like lectin/glucanase superfamily, partial [Pseudonocardiales bacterium]|nr:Concanavalin A-like lectin/glucanase superfamily [Pseudonocardiales bacterium]
MGDRWRDFAIGQPLPSTWTDGIEELLNTYASGHLLLEKASATTVRIAASTTTGQVALAIRGKPRWITATITAAHPGGAAGTYDIWATTAADSFASTPGPPAGEVDNTNHAFALKITAQGATPTGVGSEALYRRVGTLVWDGAQITAIDPLVGGAANNPTAGEKAALAGTTGVPGSGNRYVTDADARVQRQTPLVAAQVREVGILNQIRAGRQLALADWTAMGLAAPVAGWNLSDLTDYSGNGRALTNKGAVPFAPGINGLASTAAQFAGSTAQALYIADTGAADPFRIKTGSWGCWFRTAKRGVAQYILSKMLTGGVAANISFALSVSAGNVPTVEGYVGTYVVATGLTDVCDDRWHFLSATHDGMRLRLYVDGVLEGSSAATGPLGAGAPGPLNIGGYGADAATAATLPSYGREDEPFVTADVLSEDQVRYLMSASVPHTLGAIPSTARMAVRRRKRGGALATSDFPTPASLVRGHNFVAGSLADFGANAVALTSNPGTGAIVTVAAPDGTRDGAFHFSGAHTGLSATDAGLPAALTARSYGAWFKILTGAAQQNIIGWGTLSTGDTRLNVSTAGALQTQNGADTIVGPVVGDGQVYFGVVVEDNAAADGVKRKLYLNGRLVGVSTVMNTLTLAGANRFRVGAAPDGTLPVGGGQVAPPWVYSGTQNPEQVL